MQKQSFARHLRKVMNFQGFKNAMHTWLLLSKCLLDILRAWQLVRKDESNTISISVDGGGVQQIKK